MKSFGFEYLLKRFRAVQCVFHRDVGSVVLDSVNMAFRDEK